MDDSMLSAHNAIKNARHWLKELKRAWPRRNQSGSQRGYVRHCIKCYKEWCDKV